MDSPTLEFEMNGFELYLPPTSFKSRFVMWDDVSEMFYDVEFIKPLPGETTKTWEELIPETIKDPAIVFPPEQRGMLEGYEAPFAVGHLVSITKREGGRLYAQSLGRVNVKPLYPKFMSWAGLKNVKGAVLADEMKAGLMKRLWNRRPDDTGKRASFSYQTSRYVLDNMPRKWHLDGAALNYELDHMFVAGMYLDPTQKWVLSGLGTADTEKSQKFLQAAANKALFG